MGGSGGGLATGEQAGGEEAEEAFHHRGSRVFGLVAPPRSAVPVELALAGRGGQGKKALVRAM
jgi:hypothetical protein